MGSPILKWTTLAAVVVAVGMGVLGIVIQFYPSDLVSIECFLGTLLLVLAALLAYLFEGMTLVDKRTSLIVDKLGLQDIETIKTVDKLTDKLISTTIGSQCVRTQMFSEPPSEIGSPLVKYFKVTGNYIKKTPKMNFRSVFT